LRTQRRPRLYYGWIIVAVVTLAGFAQSTGTFVVMGVFMKPVTDEFHWSRSVFTAAMSIGTFIGAFIAPAVGAHIDRFGPRWFLTASFSIFGATLILFSQVSNLWQYYAVQIATRIVHMGAISPALNVIVPKWFVTQRGRAVGIASMGIRLGMTLNPLLAQVLVSRSGWRTATSAIAILVWSMAVLPVALFFRRQPEDLGLLPDGATLEELEKRRQAAATAGGPVSRRLDVSFTPRQVLLHPSFYLLTAAFSLGFLVVSASSLHFIPYLTDQAVTPGMAVIALAVWSAAAIPGALGAGLIAERVSPRGVLIVIFLLMGSSFVLLLGVRSASQALLWGFYYGIVEGGVFIVQEVIYADYYGRQHLGAIRGIVWPVQATANALGGLIAAIAYDTTGSYAMIFIVFGVLCLLSAACLVLARPPALPSPKV
jgi:MFS family permease